tara:strand:+ start:834 stop:1904 length:1071 start_codon:yes stop_codon:yes gene_type:complete
MASTAIFRKEAAVAHSGRSAMGRLDGFDLDGSLDLVARLQKAAAAEGALAPPYTEDEDQEDKNKKRGILAPPFTKKDGEEKKAGLAPPFKKKSDEDDDVDDNGGSLAPPFKKKSEKPDEDDDEEKTAEVASAAVIRQALADVCHVLAGGDPVLDKTAGVIGVALLDGHRGHDVAAFLGGMEKQAFPLSPWKDLPDAGALGRVRQMVYKTPEEKNLQAEGRLARTQAKATAGIDRQLLKDETLYANRAATRASADAADRLSQIRAHMAGGLTRPDAEKLMADQVTKQNKTFVSRARDAAGLDKNKIRLGLGGVGLDVNKRLFTKTAPMMLAPLAAGYLLGGGLRKDDDERPRGITIS